jgi:DNA polymerase (family 10)
MTARKRAPSNAEIARALRELSLLLEMDGVQFKPRAYEKAALAIESRAGSVAELDEAGGWRALDRVPGVGKGIAGKIEELLASGHIGELDELRAKYPIDLLALTDVEGVGAKAAKAFYESLGVRNLEELEAAARAGRLREIPRFGAKSEAKILQALEIVRQSRGRVLLGSVLPLAREIESRLGAAKFVDSVAVAGSIRRRKETIGDLDFLVASSAPARVMELFVAQPDVTQVLAQGETKAMVRLANGLQADLRVIPKESFGAALAYFTGSKAHNVSLRKIAQAKGLKLNEYGLFRGERAIAGRTEKELYAALGLELVPPELREDAGEIEAALAGELPELVAYGSLRGDLQLQSHWSDGTSSIEELARAARELGLEYVAITDHTRDLVLARGCDEKRLLEQKAEIARLQPRLRGIRVLSGAEVNIREDGSLDIDDETLAQLDVVGASIHSYFHQSRADATRRVIRAIENPNVDILFHPTARSIGKRAPVDFDVDAVIAAAARTGTVLEIDAMPDRLDLRDQHVRKAVTAGVKLAIDSDAHQPSHLRFADELGVAVARRGWARASDVINTLPVAKFQACLKDARGRARDRARA